ncbi:restriction endonuclease subunit S [Acidiphilium sp.]|uniref:restriction endonuclease subunit S n=1 Tax=Acidiphilium sp. TaxID=527 RepID=UPI00258AAE15|nr:restriction endonuclease subunit S [Acidiphilium sp.]
MSNAAVELGRICRMDRRTTATSDALGRGLEFVGMEHVDPETGQIVLGQGSRTGEGKGQAFLFDDRHVLFGKLRPYLRKIALPRQAGCASTELVPLLPDANRLDRGYLFHWVRQQAVIDTLMAKNTGARMPRADMSVLLEMPIPLPPLEEQRRIVRLLDRAAEIRRRADAARAKARAIIPALFLDMFGDPATNPKGWPVARLGSLLDRIDGGWSPVCGDGAPASDQWGVLKLSAVKSLGFVGSEAKRLPETITPRGDLEVHEGDLLITRKNTIDLVGTAAVADSSGRNRLLPDTIFRLVPSDPVRFLPRYLSTLINLPSFRPAIRHLASGSASSMPGISKGRLSALEIPLPPLPLQTAFAQQAQRLEATARALDIAAAKVEAMCAALSAEMFV